MDFKLRQKIRYSNSGKTYYKTIHANFSVPELDLFDQWLSIECKDYDNNQFPHSNWARKEFTKEIKDVSVPMYNKVLGMINKHVEGIKADREAEQAKINAENAWSNKVIPNTKTAKGVLYEHLLERFSHAADHTYYRPYHVIAFMLQRLIGASVEMRRVEKSNHKFPVLTEFTVYELPRQDLPSIFEKVHPKEMKHDVTYIVRHNTANVGIAKLTVNYQHIIALESTLFYKLNDEVKPFIDNLIIL